MIVELIVRRHRRYPWPVVALVAVYATTRFCLWWMGEEAGL